MSWAWFWWLLTGFIAGFGTAAYLLYKWLQKTMNDVDIFKLLRGIQ